MAIDSLVYRIPAAASLLVVCSGALAQGPEPVIAAADPALLTPKEEELDGWILKDASAAISASETAFGASLVNPKAKLVVLAEDNTPFLSVRLIGHPVWHVVTSGFPLHLESAGAQLKDSYDRIWEFFLDPKTGQLLKVVSLWPESVPRIADEPSADSYAAQMQRSGQEKYHGFPSQKPATTFLQAIDSVFAGAANPLAAEQIVGQYLIWSFLEYPPRPVWVVTLRSRESWLNSSRAEGRIHNRNHMRYLVDAQTGRWFRGSSTPQPEIENQGKTKGDSAIPQP